MSTGERGRTGTGPNEWGWGRTSGDGPERAGMGTDERGRARTYGDGDGPEHAGTGPNKRGWGQTSGDRPERAGTGTDKRGQAWTSRTSGENMNERERVIVFYFI